MPEHVHMIIWIPTEATISGILKSVNSSLSRRALYWVRKQTPRQLPLFRYVRPDGTVEHRFWQAGGGYERLLRSPHDVHEKIRYIHANPVRRGLVSREEDWQWSSAQAYATGVDGLLRLDRQFIPTVMNYD